MVSCKEVVLLLIYCFMYLPLFVGVFVLVCITLCPFYFCNHLDEEERAGCFALNVFGMSCYCYCSVALPHCALG